MEQNLVSNVFTRYNTLSTYNTADDVCNKMNAEFNATFYRSHNDVWMSYTDEKGKPMARKLSGVN